MSKVKKTTTSVDIDAGKSTKKHPEVLSCLDNHTNFRSYKEIIS